MRWVRSAGLLALLAALLVSCSRADDNGPASPGTVPVDAPNSGQATPGTTNSPAEPPAKGPGKPPITGEKPVSVRFRLGTRSTEPARELLPGSSATIGTEPLEVTVLLPGVNEQVARQAVGVEGAAVEGEPEWASTGALTLRLSGGKAGETVTVKAQVPGGGILSLRRAAQAAVTVDFRYGDAWQPVTLLSSHVSAGTAEIRINFSKPVDRATVEKALTANQAALVRGLMQWPNDRTLIWALAEMPPRLDILLNGARDADGLPLPGGIPSLRTGQGPELVELTPGEPGPPKVIGRVLSDVASAKLSRDGKFLNLLAWVPGTNRWDWLARDYHIDLQTGTLKPGKVDSTAPRAAAGLVNWVVNPQGTLVAGLRASRTPGIADLVIADMQGSRQQVVPSFVATSPLGNTLAWSADGTRVAASNWTVDQTGTRKAAGLLVLTVPSTQPKALFGDVMVHPAAALAWSPDGRYISAGNHLLDLQTETSMALPFQGSLGRGLWESGGQRLLYSQEDWGPLFFVELSPWKITPAGTGLLVGWSAEGKAYAIQWPASSSRYEPPGP